jgi:hypothetical protein
MQGKEADQAKQSLLNLITFLQAAQGTQEAEDFFDCLLSISGALLQQLPLRADDRPSPMIISSAYKVAGSAHSKSSEREISKIHRPHDCIPRELTTCP